MRNTQNQSQIEQATYIYDDGLYLPPSPTCQHVSPYVLNWKAPQQPYPDEMPDNAWCYSQMNVAYALAGRLSCSGELEFYVPLC